MTVNGKGSRCTLVMPRHGSGTTATTTSLRATRSRPRRSELHGPRTGGTAPGDYKMIGRTDGGRLLTIVVRWDLSRRTLRPITGWDSTAGERTRYGGQV